MNKLRCIVVDDEPLAVQMIENYISRTPSLELMASFTDPVEALSQVKSLRPELAFLDIQMPDLSGLELSKMLPENTRVIFTTAFKEYALESYDVDALAYLLKPIRYQKFVEAAEKAINYFNMKEAASAAVQSPKTTSIFIKSDGNLHKVELSDILYISGLKDYLSIRLESQDAPLITHLTMKAAGELLPEGAFMRVHKSFIVALDKIESVTRDNDIVIAGKLIHIGDQYLAAFRKWLGMRSFAPAQDDGLSARCGTV
ncbi:MAG: response regulator transcription factor [Bacteroidales bacterium]|nr:response regulator transcription factor [Bacteroidales bacterium]